MTTTFTDCKGREWDVSLDLRKARFIDKSNFKEYWDKEFSILNLDKLLIQKLLTDASFLFAIIWAMVQDQAEAKWQTYDGWTKHQPAGSTTIPPGGFPVPPKEEPEKAELEFVSGINGPVIEAGRQAFMEALGDFFPDQRTGLSILLKGMKTLNQKLEKKSEELAPLMDSILDEELDERINQMKAQLKGQEKSSGEVSLLSPVSPASASQTSGVPAIPSST